MQLQENSSRKANSFSPPRNLQLKDLLLCHILNSLVTSQSDLFDHRRQFFYTTLNIVELKHLSPNAM